MSCCVRSFVACSELGQMSTECGGVLCCPVNAFRTCQVSCRLGGKSSFVIAFLQIMGVTTYSAQGYAGSFHGTARRSKLSSPWSSLSMMTLPV